MKRLLCVVACLFPALLLAQSPFDGTWKTNMSESKLSQKPYVYSVNNGMYSCDSCAPKIMNVKADGTDQAVVGQTYDMISVQVVNPNQIRLITKKAGKTTGDSTRTASDDGKMLTIAGSTYPPDGSPYKFEAKLMRMSNGPAGSNATSGSWRLQNINEDKAGITMTFKISGDEVSYSSASGTTWTAKFGGPEQPVKGVYDNQTVSVKKLGDRSIEVTLKRDGKVIVVNKITISPDGKKMTELYDSKLTGRISTYMDEKQ